VTGLALAGLTGLGRPAYATGGPTATDLRAALDSELALRVDGQLLRVPVLREFYGGIGFEPVWGSDPGGIARTALALDALAGARDHGLTPAHYDVAALRRRAEAGTSTAAIERELLLTDALLRYATDLRAGRLRPTAVQPDWGIPLPDRNDPIRELVDAIEAGTLAAWLETLPPSHEGYARLVKALRALHAQAARGGAGGRSGVDPHVRQVALNLERWRSSRTDRCAWPPRSSWATSSTPPRWSAPR
jgi:L,D-transpeptidase YcbB